MIEYIRKDVAREYLEKACFCIGGNGGMMLKIKFDEEPAADVRENVRGKWIDGKCDKCGEHAPFWSMASTYYKSNFCPNCGAEMKGETDG